MSDKNDNKPDELETLEWLKLKTSQGKTPDYIKQATLEKPANKFVRKIKENPFVPIGTMATVLFLGYGLKSMYTGDRMKSQMMMRGRIAAQGFTVVALLGGLFYKGMGALKEAEEEEKKNSEV
ncbi:HIG1 domain family member 2A, mitochondrial [Adelges cooleyi]|uniref:HIG1 domain family member 2A, mitochondrial n=1 Tax=Adelges cooleyi TaxID=133065 RepID=UPI0021808C95|nr:HIG1 domain family member 2A, mitochondrial [Adelges cooleyi]